MKKAFFYIYFFIFFCISIVSGSDKLDKTSDNAPNVVTFLSEELKKDKFYIILVEKSSQKLFLYSYDGSYKLIEQMNCSTGKASGYKTQSGDKKTPEGVYFFNNVHEDRDLTPIYGIRAFPIDYPNSLDKFNEFDGSAIWLHGTNKTLLPNDSNGCVALKNDDIDKITKYITLKKTPIIILDKIDYSLSDTLLKEKGKKIKLFLWNWGKSITEGVYHEYLSYYSSNFLPDITWWNSWFKLRGKYNTRNFYIKIDNISVFNHNDDVFVAVFDMYITSPFKESAYIGKNKLFISFYNNEPTIISEEFLKVTDSYKDSDFKHPIFASYNKLENIILERETRESKKNIERKRELKKENIRTMLANWANAWSSKNIEEYIKHYSKDFKSDDFNKTTWREYKEKLNKQYDYIKVQIEDLKIELDDKKVSAIFIQRYESDKYKALGKKTLILLFEGDEWKIYKETWEEI
jgi:murein L,D-transpeptidase YafK